MTEPRLHVCMGCRPQGQSVEEQELALERLQNDLVDRIEIATYPCLSGCQQRGRASFCSAKKGVGCSATSILPMTVRH